MKRCINDTLKIDKNLKRMLVKDFKLFKPVCSKCGKELKDGDYVDHYFPLYQDLNICKKCLYDK